MRNGAIAAVSIALLLCLCFGRLLMPHAWAQEEQPGQPPAELTAFTVAVPTEAPQPDRWTTLICRFDRAESFDADYAGGNRVAGGCFDACELGKEGKYGSSVFVDHEWGLLMYQGRANVNSLMGSADFWVKSAPEESIWADGRDHHLLGVHCAGWLAPESLLYHICICRHRFGYFRSDLDEAPPLPEIEIPCADLAADQWHHLLVSWDTQTDRLWLAIDGEGQGLQLSAHVPPGEVRALYVGGRRYAHHLRKNAGACLDELRLTSRSVGWQAAHTLRSIEAETGFTEEIRFNALSYVRAKLGRYAETQRFGGWGGSAWPVRGKIGEYWARSWAPQGSFVDFGKAHVGTTLTAARFLVTYEGLREQWLYDVAAKTGEMLLLTQHEDGWWVEWALEVTPAGLRYYLPPRTAKTDWMHNLVNIDDLIQARPMFLLCWLYRLSGEERFLEGAIRSGDFALGTQNPNGGWGHFWNLEAQRTMGSSGYRWEASEFEDFAFIGAFYQMLVAYRFTGDETYLDAALRGADWVIDAQLDAPTRGWAEQYDAENVPAWGRDFEPPSCSMMVAIDACEGLRAAFLITREEKYLKPIADFLAWARETPHRDGNMFYWTYDVATGRPIAAPNRERIYFVDDPDDLAAYRKATAVTKRGEKVKEFDIDYWTHVVEQGRAGTLKPECAFATLQDVADFLRERADSPVGGGYSSLRAAAILSREVEFQPTLCSFALDWRDWPLWAYPYPDLYDREPPPTRPD